MSCSEVYSYSEKENTKNNKSKYAVKNIVYNGVGIVGGAVAGHLAEDIFHIPRGAGIGLLFGGTGFVVPSLVCAKLNAYDYSRELCCKVKDYITECTEHKVERYTHPTVDKTKEISFKERHNSLSTLNNIRKSALNSEIVLPSKIKTKLS